MITLARMGTRAPGLNAGDLYETLVSLNRPSERDKDNLHLHASRRASQAIRLLRM